jgi:transcriptional regulator with XRE-family HTH domain
MTEGVVLNAEYDLAKPIASVMQQAGITQREFAELIGVSRVTVNRWVAGASKPSPAIHRVLSKVLIVLGVAINEGKLPANIPPAHSKTVVERQEVITRIYNEVYATLPKLNEG